MLPPNPQLKMHDLRWRFDYADRPSKWGKWSSPGKTPEVMAYTQNKEGVIRAAIEARSVDTQRESILAECDGWNFNNFQWIAIAMTPGNFKGEVRPVHALVGLKIITTDEEISVFANGMVMRRARTEQEKGINFATFGR